MQCFIPDWSVAFSGYVLIARMISVVVETFILHQISCCGFGMNKILSVLCPNANFIKTVSLFFYVD